MKAPTKKQIALVENITEVLEIDFPQSSVEFTKQIYCKFIKRHYDEFKRIVEDTNGLNFEDEMSWFQMLNG